MEDLGDKENYLGTVFMNSQGNINSIQRKVNSCYFFPELSDDSASIASTNKGKERILLVDDEKFNLDALNFIIKSCFKNLGKDPDRVKQIVDFAGDGDEAVECVKQLSETENRYAIVFTDYSMPKKDGY